MVNRRKRGKAAQNEVANAAADLIGTKPCSATLNVVAFQQLDDRGRGVAPSTHLLRDQTPAGRKSWTIRTADINIVIQIPDRCLACPGVVKQIIRFAVTVQV